jgi:hypothetical protein
MHLRALVGCRHLHDAIGVNLEGDLNLRYATRRRRNAVELEFAEEVIILRQRTLAFKDLNQHCWLIICSRREAAIMSVGIALISRYYLHLTLPGGDNSVAGDEFGEHSTRGLNSESEGANIDKKDRVRALSAGKNATLDSGAIGYSFIGVDSLGRFLATEEFLEQLLYLGNTC